MKGVDKTARQAEGFTLVELQVALLLVSLMAVLLVGALQLSSQTWTKVTEKQDLSEHRFLVSRMLRKHLGNMRFLRVRNDSGEIMNSVIGADDQFHFLAPYPSFQNDGNLYWWSLKNQWDEETQSLLLVMDYLPYLAGEVIFIESDGSLSYEDQEPSRITVAKGLRLSDLAYYSRDSQGVESWDDEWEPNTASLLVVRFTLTEIIDGDTEVVLPEIAVSPHFANQKLYADTWSQ